MKTKKLAVIGFGARGKIYSQFAEQYPEKFELVAVIVSLHFVQPDALASLYSTL